MALCEQGDIITIPTDICEEEKKKLASISEKILQAVCALLNCYGGIIRVNDATVQVRSIEQRIMKMIGIIAFHWYVKVKAAEANHTDYQVLIQVKKSKKFITLNYNLCFPTEEQINVVQSTDDIDLIREDLNQGIIEDCVTMGSHWQNTFVLGEPSGLKESEVVQLKSLKAKESKANTFATRMVNEKNKFSLYISGFANHRGGHIYYGINDKGVVTGEKIVEKDKQDVEDKASIAIKKLIWSEHRIKPEKGVHWNIHLENVKDKNNSTVESTYVVVVFVACYRGGVFTEEPESYYIKEGKVKRMEFDLWWKAFSTGAFLKYSTKLNNVGSITWSSLENMKFFIKLSEKLVDHRDSGDRKSFNDLCKIAAENFTERNANLVVKAGEITIAYKSGNFKDAERFLKEFEGLLSSSKDRSIFEVRFLLSQSLVARSQGNYAESYQRSKEGLQLAQNIPPGLCILWLYLECAMNAACLGLKNEHDEKNYNEMKQEALFFLNEASKVAFTLIEEKIPYRIADFQHKLGIYKAWVLINSCVTGEAAAIAPSENDLKAARSELLSVEKNLDKNPLSKFRAIEYNLVKCDHSARLSENLKDSVKKIQYLECALQHATAAHVLAAKDEFNNLTKYAENRCNILKERVKLCKDDLRQSTVRTFEGFEY